MCITGCIDHTVVYFDDILVTGASTEEHLHTLDRVPSKLADSGLRLKKAKCIFGKMYIHGSFGGLFGSSY